jgi:hypothetical protein
MTFCSVSRTDSGSILGRSETAPEKSQRSHKPESPDRWENRTIAAAMHSPKCHFCVRRLYDGLPSPS